MGLHLHRWQAIAAAVLTALATVAAALIAGNHASGPPGRPDNSGGPPPGDTPTTVSVTSWSEASAAPPPTKKRYRFYGRAVNLPADAEIHVIVESRPGARGAAWLISPTADVLRDGTWKVAWTLTEPPSEGRWIAIVVHVPSAPSEETLPVTPRPPPTASGDLPPPPFTSGPPVSTLSPRETPTEGSEPTRDPDPTGQPPDSLSDVADSGPAAGNVVASAQAPPPD
ncbi:hypothetical protein [Streptomyces sp. YU58]|uniref:hypothetical protein n=1 Tax=Streptomyces sp. SX92 TaxID=3158972 RepID=UPI0027BA43F4|nr:hypothetical protein [Streptomyces coralus]WLW57677.1 hypothetical protein QU709_42725 [Streptomyces coralus]